jgi:hypothetical protein
MNLDSIIHQDPVFTLATDEVRTRGVSLLPPGADRYLSAVVRIPEALLCSITNTTTSEEHYYSQAVHFTTLRE